MTRQIEQTKNPDKMHLKEEFFDGADIKSGVQFFVGEEEEEERGG